MIWGGGVLSSDDDDDDDEISMLVAVGAGFTFQRKTGRQDFAAMTIQSRTLRVG